MLFEERVIFLGSMQYTRLALAMCSNQIHSTLGGRELLLRDASCPSYIAK